MQAVAGAGGQSVCFLVGLSASAVPDVLKLVGLSASVIPDVLKLDQLFVALLGELSLVIQVYGQGNLRCWQASRSGR